MRTHSHTKRSSLLAKSAILLTALLGTAGIHATDSDACTRVMYKGNNGIILTARSMDWKEDIQTDLWIFPRGMKRDGATGENSLRWTSRYGSVIATAYNIATADGMNEMGLSANLLWLAESEFPEWDKSKPGLSISLWAQYVLDNFATVAEAVEAMREEPFTLVSAYIPNMPDKFATLHLSISDASGDNAIFEYIDGRLVIHHDPSYQVMTNSPIFEEQLALNAYWEEIGGTVMLPGTNRAADRFVRASFYTHAIPVTGDIRIASAAAMSVIRNCSVPYGISTPGQPNISSTIWRTLANQRDRIYYYESVMSPNIFWIDFDDVDFSKGAPVKTLKLTDGSIYSGNAVAAFRPSAPFTFEGIR